MKASDYVAKFKAEGSTVEALANVIVEMMVEVRDIGRTRRISTDEAVFSILNEVDQKFGSFVRQTGGKLSDGSFFRGEGFRQMLRLKMPDIFDAWNRRRGGRLLVDWTRGLTAQRVEQSDCSRIEICGFLLQKI